LNKYGIDQEVNQLEMTTGAINNEIDIAAAETEFIEELNQAPQAGRFLHKKPRIK
jgi:hypothetical protein